MPIKYVGRTTTFKGKPLWEIVGNLKNFGVGRMVIRHSNKRYPEPSYMRILKVEALPDTSKHPHDPRKVTVFVENTFRGVTVPTPISLEAVSYKADFMLVPKDEEAHYLNSSSVSQRSTKIMPSTIDFPPLLKELLIRDAKKQRKHDYVPELKVVYNFSGIKNYRVAKEGEIPTVNISMGLGTPASPSLYSNIKPEDSS